MDRLTDRLDMTIAVDWDVKQHSNKQIKIRNFSRSKSLVASRSNMISVISLSQTEPRQANLCLRAFCHDKF